LGLLAQQAPRFLASGEARRPAMYGAVLMIKLIETREIAPLHLGASGQ
jgi:hypothetical protein